MLHQLAPEEIGAFWEEGFVILEDFLSAAETGVLQTAAGSDYHSGRDELFRVVARTRRAVEAMESLVELQEVYLCEAKLGDDVRAEWHQDYGDWYDEGCLYPELGRLLIALQPCTWTLLRGSNKLGRIDHVDVGGTRLADPRRAAQLADRLDIGRAELEPGDAMFVHPNTLQRGAPHVAVSCVYNTRHNEPIEPGAIPAYEPIHQLPDSAILTFGKPVREVRPMEYLSEFSDANEDKGRDATE